MKNIVKLYLKIMCTNVPDEALSASWGMLVFFVHFACLNFCIFDRLTDLEFKLHTVFPRISESRFFYRKWNFEGFCKNLLKTKVDF